MKKFKLMLSILFVFVFALSLVSCGEKYESGEKDNGETGNEGDSSSEIVVQDTTRKIYYTVQMSIKAEDISSEIKLINEKVAEYNGYLESSSTNYDDDKLESGTNVYRVPTEKLEDFLAYVDKNANITYKNIESTDITSNYNTVEAKIEVLESYKKIYEDELEKATDATTKITILDKIADIDVQLATLAKEKGSYDSLLNYSTITIRFYSKATIVEETYWSEYGQYLIALGKGIVSIFLYTLPFTLIGGAVTFICVKSAKKKKAKKEENKDE